MSSLLYVIVLLIIEPVYHTNDDAMMSLISTGKLFTQSPQPNLFYIHYYIGLILVHLQSIAPKTHWYGLMLVFGNYVASTFLLYSFLTQRRSLLRFSFFLLFFFIYQLYFIQVIQMSSTAMMLAIAGFFVFMTGIEMKSRRELLLWIVLSFLLFTFSFFIRKEAVLAIFPVMIIPIVVRLWKMRSLKKLLVYTLFGLSLMLCSAFHSKTFFKNEEWKNVNSLNHSFCQIWDYHKIDLGSFDEKLKDVFRGHLINNDLFMGRYVWDESVFHYSEIKSVIDERVASSKTMAGRDFDFGTILRNFRFPRNLIMLLLIIGFIFYQAIIEKKNSDKLFIQIFSLLSTLLLFCFLQKFFKLPLYFFMPILGLNALLGIYFSDESKLHNIKGFHEIACVVSLVTAILFLHHCYITDTLEGRKHYIQFQPLAHFMQQHPDKLYFADHEFPIGYLPVFASTENLNQLKMISVEGILSFSPYKDERLKAFQFHNSSVALASGQAYLISGPYFSNTFKQFVFDNYKTTLKEKILFEGNDNLSIIQFQ